MRVSYDLDILKPHQPGVDLVAKALLEINGVIKVRLKVDELDQKTASLHVKVEGFNVSLEEITEKLEELNCALHSVDEVLCERDDTNMVNK